MSENLQKDIARNYGLMLGVIGLTMVVIQYALGEFSIGGGQEPPSMLSIIMSAVSIILGIVLVILAQKNVRDNQGYLSFGEGFKLGFTIFIIASLFTAAWTLVYTYLLEPGYQAVLLEEAADEMYQQGNLSDDKIDQAIEMTRQFTSPWMLAILRILLAALYGAIVSAITAAIMKKDKPYNFNEESEV